MKRNSFSVTARVTTGTLFFIIGIVLCVFALFTPRSRSAAPASGTLSPTSAPITWTGTGTGGASADESTCAEGFNCDTFALTLSGTPANWVGKKAHVEIHWANPSGVTDYDLYIHKGATNSGPIVAQSAGSSNPEAADIDPNAAGVGTGAFSVHVVYFTAIADQYSGSVSVTGGGTGPTPTPIPAATPDTGPKIGYENFEAPGVLTPVTTTTGPTNEYLGRGAGEPSIGVNWSNDVTNFQSDLQTLFVSFANACPTGGPTATWVNRRAPTSQVIDSDPIGFTDHPPGFNRVFAAELSATSPSCKISFSDNDGNIWAPTSGPLGSGIDHETIGGGPYSLPVPTPVPFPTPGPIPGTIYPNAVYYCSQDLVAAFCLRSDDGGATWGPPIQTYTTQCGGLHGHVKVGPDGTVYLPNNSCAGQGAVVVSTNSGVTWNVRNVKNASLAMTSGDSDPAVAIDDSNKVYFVMASENKAAAVATSVDHGLTWQNFYDVGAAYGLKNIRYPAAIAGDAGRAAVAFYGTTTPGDANSSGFAGIWHVYVAHTFDGGATWTTTDATPGAPIQRGCIWTGGGANICRNLLDFFDMTIDSKGRVQAGYVNGCPGGNCAQSAPTATGNAYSATATIARQSSGRRLRAAFDPPSPLTATSVPGMPSVTQRRIGGVVHLGWSEGDTGNSTVTSYQVLRGTSSGSETLIATLPGTVARFDDAGAFDTSKTYYYKVVAVNAVGSSCANNEIVAPYVGDTCGGVIIHKNDPTHPESTVAAANPQLAIDYIAVGEPSVTPPATPNLMFKMKVANLSSPPANARWRMVWDSYSSPGQQWYVGMNTDSNGAASFVYGTVATAVVGLVVGVPQETPAGTALPASNKNPDGTITIFIPKSAVGNPQPGDLLGAVNGRTFSDNSNLERSTTLIDHTFVKAQTDNGFPAATYTVAGNCITPQKAESVKIHGTVGPLVISLPLSGFPGVECRVGRPSGKDFQVVTTFPVPILSITGASVSSRDGLATADSPILTTVSGKGVVTVNVHNVANAQTIGVALLGVSDGTNSGNVTVPMSVLLGDVNGDGKVLNGDVGLVKDNVSNPVSQSNCRSDVTADGRLLNGDVGVTKAQVSTFLPP